MPPWVKDPRNFTLLVNARVESVNEKPAFRNAMRRRRCLFPADGFYEWKDEGGRKRPYCIRPKDRAPIAFAGLWETWMGPNGEEMETAAIITTDANRDLAQLHSRMPVVIAAARIRSVARLRAHRRDDRDGASCPRRRDASRRTRFPPRSTGPQTKGRR